MDRIDYDIEEAISNTDQARGVLDKTYESLSRYRTFMVSIDLTYLHVAIVRCMQKWELLPAWLWCLL